MFKRLMRRNAYKAVGRCRIKSMKSKIPRNGNQCIGERLALDRRVYTYSIAGKGKAERYVRAQVHPILCDPLACNSPGSFARGILHATILKWVAISYSKGSSQPNDQAHVSFVSCIGRWVLYHCATSGAQVFMQVVECSVIRS